MVRPLWAKRHKGPKGVVYLHADALRGGLFAILILIRKAGIRILVVRALGFGWWSLFAPRRG